MFSFGCIADVQCADVEDGFNFDKTVRRCYRGALVQLGTAVDWWAKASEAPAFIAQLGDLIDGKNAQEGHSQQMLDKALAHFHRIPIRTIRGQAGFKPLTTPHQLMLLHNPYHFKASSWLSWFGFCWWQI